MKFTSVSINNCYILDNEVFDNKFFNYYNAKAIYSASMFHLAFYKGDINLIPEEILKEYEKYSIKLYSLNSKYLYIPFEIDYHESFLYQSYYESDHFPLSVWIEEKSLIPFKIFIQIIEDTLYGLLTLENTGHSHLFLTPEEILLPLQWNNNTHVKLYNVGLNSIVKTFLSEEQIKNYRNNYYNNRNISVETKLIKNVSEDIYSFGKIIITILPFCDFEHEKDKIAIQKILDRITRNPELYNSVNQVIELFDSFFKKLSNMKTFSNNNLDYSYTGQASFNIPEFDEWKEEAVLEPISENIDASSSLTKPKETIPEKEEKKSILNTVSSLIKYFFFKKKKNLSVSKTLNDYTDTNIVNKTDTIKDNNNESKKNDTYSHPVKSLNKTKSNSNLDTTKTNKIVKEMDNNNKTYEQTDNTSLLSNHYSKNGFDINDKNPETSTVISNLDSTSSNNIVFDEFNKSLLERDYIKSFNIIKTSLTADVLSENNINNNLENILIDKLKQLDNHYIIDSKSNIINTLLKLDEINPMTITDSNRNNVFRNEIKDFSKKLNDNEISNKNMNIFLKILNYLKLKYKKLTNK